ncbi:elongation factor 2 [Crepidotus variabilis]|uniref:Elongation factor 2 n=1 Tax=Crepidotus variabilis TaxID=179855 RepID=A0A9P6E8T7_9AGAR|nr:elongation factor 2 [Crepidotus variabilis]
MFVLDLLFKLFNGVMNSQKDILWSILKRIEINLTSDERKLEGTALFKVVLQKYLPASDTLLDMIVIHLPSPITAQRDRVETLYEGPMDGESAIAIQKCDPSGPLVLYVSNMMPATEKGKFYSFGRVFSGIVKAGLKVYIQGPKFVPGRKADLLVKSIDHLIPMIGDNSELIEDCPAGNLIYLTGIDQFILKTATLTTSDITHNIRPLRFSSLVVQVAVEVKIAEDLPKLVTGLKHLSRSDHSVETWSSDTGKYIVAGVGKLHLEVCLTDLEGYAGVELKISEPFASYRETIRAESSIVALAKSPNRYNRIYLKATPMSEELTKAIEDGTINAREDFKSRGRRLADEFGWDTKDARKIWCFGPDVTGSNLLVDTTQGVQFLNEIKDACVAGFQWASKEGVLCEEGMRGVRVNVPDVALLSDAIHRGAGQIIPTMRRATYAACLLAQPALQEPVYLVEVQCTDNSIRHVQKCLTQRRGRIVSEKERLQSQMYTIKAYLPIVESFGFEEELRLSTAGLAVSLSTFDHWELIGGDPLKKGRAEDIVSSIRVQKGLAPSIPSLDRYLDKLPRIGLSQLLMNPPIRKSQYARISHFTRIIIRLLLNGQSGLLTSHWQ